MFLNKISFPYKERTFVVKLMHNLSSFNFPLYITSGVFLNTYSESGRMYTRNFFDVPIVFSFLLTLLIFMLTYLGANCFSIKHIPRYSIDSMLFPKNLSLLEKHFRIAKLSKARALHFESMGFVDAARH